MMFGEENIGNESPYTEMTGGIMILCAAVGIAMNMFLCALLYQNYLWTLINRALLAISVVGHWQHWNYWSLIGW